MEELSIEEKAKRYDKALVKARNIVNSINVGLIGKDSFEAVFPELKEPEDKRIRNFISNELVCLRATEGKDSDRYKELTNAIAWFEKQGEHINFLSKIQIGDKVTCNENGILVNLSQLNRIAKKRGEQNINLPSFDEAQGTPIVKQGEQSKKHDVCDTCDEKDSCISPCCVKLVEEQGEHKPAEWSEEDRIRITNCIQLIGKTGDGEVKWLKSLENRILPQLKQKWNKEDERKIGDIRDAITLDDELEESYKKELYDFLKSLRPQNKWKPSSDQLAALFCAIPYIHCSSTRACACSLYRDLKKLIKI